MKKTLRLVFSSLLVLMAAGVPARAQWISQSFNLRSGWNAIYLHIDLSHTSLNDLVAVNTNNPVTEVWMWVPPLSTIQYIQSPLDPTTANSQWLSWNRQSTNTASLRTLMGNAAYLVRVATNTAAYAWTLKGRPVAPAYEWSTSGANLLGFPTVPTNPPRFVNFLAKAPDLQQNTEIYYYPGGELGAGNPMRLLTLNTSPVNRGQAYWVRTVNAATFNRYYAPFETVLAGANGIDFGDTRNSYSFRLRNLTATNLTVTLRLAASEAPPAGQTNIVAVPPLLVRGNLNTTNLTYNYKSLPLGGTNTWTLAGNGQPGSEVEVVLGLNRTALTGGAGSRHAGILRLSDALGFALIDLPVSAMAASDAGLWIGAAAVSQVGHYLKTYARDVSDTPVMSTNGQYVVQATNTSLGTVAKTFPLRLIVHNPASGNAVLLQRVYVGIGASTNPVIATQETALNHAFVDKARRISAVHLPWSRTNATWAFNGSLGGSTQLTTTVTLDYADQASNPFLHTYHPDHDNLDSSFANLLPRGSESYTVRRDIRLNIAPPAADGSDFEARGRTLSGDYAETVTLLGLARGGGTADTRTFEVRGVFTLTRVSTTPVLTRP